MTASQLYGKLAIERCRMQIAQLCAAAYLGDENCMGSGVRQDVLACLLKGLSQDIDLLERLLQSSED